MLGDKAEARALAERCGVPVLPATPGGVSLAEAEAFFAAQAATGGRRHGQGGRRRRRPRPARRA